MRPEASVSILDNFATGIVRVAAKVRLVLPKHPLIAAICLLGSSPWPAALARKTHKDGQMGVRRPLGETTDLQIRKSFPRN